MFGWHIIKIAGASMEPEVPAGSFACFRRRAAYGSGDILLVKHPRYGTIVKQLVNETAAGIALKGLSRHSVTSQAMGRVPKGAIMGKLAWLSAPAKR
ncbi:MAG: S24/S26 family peptidase [Pseudomonadota bacterium]